MKNCYGCIGFVSLLGIWGVLSGEPLFLSFFAFALFFEYFWVIPDEMFLDTMKKCAALAFFTDLFITAAATLVLSYCKLTDNPLAAGAALGFGISIAVFAFSAFIAETMERSRAKND
ncbi:MAG: DUF3796 domain-containing protein [Oscillospiraceae bacterium]|nr:DUF3796 domain-containing protein [Oscillospiraceae bacterium]